MSEVARAVERWDGDTEFEEYTIERVDEGETSWEVGFDRTWFGWEKTLGPRPYVGDTIRLYTKGLGYTIRGVLLNGREVYYRTPAEDAEHHRQGVERARARWREEFETTGRARLDAEYVTLPSEFKRRIDGFRQRNPEFRWTHESYEMFACTEAVKIAAALKTTEKLEGFGKLTYEQQKTLVPDLSGGHSGNTFGVACRLAYWWLANPENVVREHGALCPLLGCAGYGCEQAKKETE